MHLVTRYVDNCILLYGIPDQVLLDNGPQLVRKFFTTAWLSLGAMKLSTTVNKPQKNGQVDGYHCT